MFKTELIYCRFQCCVLKATGLLYVVSLLPLASLTLHELLSFCALLSSSIDKESVRLYSLN